MDAESSQRWRKRAFGLHVSLLVGGAVVGSLGIGGTWRAGVAVAGACWIASGLLAMYGGRSALIPNSLHAMDGVRDPERRVAVQRAGAVMGGMMLLIIGGLASAFGWALLHVHFD